MNYQIEKTIHQRGILDVEVDDSGDVVSVWYNCLALPFRVAKASADRKKDMERMYSRYNYEITGIQTKEVSKIPENLNEVLRKVVQHYWTNGVYGISINKDRIRVVLTDESLAHTFPKVLDGVLIEVICAK